MRLVVRHKPVAPIFFNNESARTQLQTGEVFTLRRKRKSTGQTTARHGNLFKFDDLGAVDVQFVKDISECSESELSEYVPKSGFKSAVDWCNARAVGANSLYRVVKT